MQTTDRIPAAGLRALLANSLDYAGLFPPASLQLEPAVRNYASYRLGADAWFLSRFVCPVNRLTELDPFTPLFAKSAPLLISALALPSPTWRDSITRLDETLDLIFSFQHSHHDWVRVDSIEVALPADLAGIAGAVETRTLIAALVEAIELSGLTGITPFFEVTAPDSGRQLGVTIDAIERHNREWNGRHCRPAALKVRTGGVKAEAFPAIDRVAFVISTCLDAGVAFKCTAGLHHPIRRYDQSIATKMHGFLNIFGAAALVHAKALSRNDLPAILEDESGSHFQFDEKGFEWNGVRAEVDQISSARRDLLVSFGSCSFEEPLEDLQELGIL